MKCNSWGQRRSWCDGRASFNGADWSFNKFPLLDLLYSSDIGLDTIICNLLQPQITGNQTAFQSTTHSQNSYPPIHCPVPRPSLPPSPMQAVPFSLALAWFLITSKIWAGRFGRARPSVKDHLDCALNFAGHIGWRQDRLQRVPCFYTCFK